ncbi:DUF4880 domain-containing protein [Oxalobacteraceae bacterium]|nr:DUF4880 domain-containing protein [Oxalobacteraceae bacterium]
MDKEVSPDLVWNTAWAWVVREHESAPFDAATRSELTLWLAAHEQHRKQYDKACRLWLLTGLVPPAFENGVPE